MTPQQLKLSVLHQAMCGRLVPQDSGDEPACVLLERIRAEKERLIRAKKIRRCDSDNIPYEKFSYQSITSSTIARCSVAVFLR
jgi:type I restriction enzyme S subunit